MKAIIKKVILLALFLLSLSTLLLKWNEISGVQTVSGTSVLSGNLLTSMLICGMYFVSIVFHEKAPKTMFCIGI